MRTFQVMIIYAASIKHNYQHLPFIFFSFSNFSLLDSDPWGKLNADPWGSGSITLRLTWICAAWSGRSPSAGRRPRRSAWPAGSPPCGHLEQQLSNITTGQKNRTLPVTSRDAPANPAFLSQNPAGFRIWQSDIGFTAKYASWSVKTER